MFRRMVVFSVAFLTISDPALPVNYNSAEEIISDCAKSVAGVVPADVLKDFEAAYNGLTSLPKISCVGVLFGDSRDTTLLFVSRKNERYYLTRVLKVNDERERFEISYSPFSYIWTTSLRLKKGQH